MAAYHSYYNQDSSTGVGSYIDPMHQKYAKEIMENSFMSPDQLDAYFEKAVKEGFNPSDVLINLRGRVECAELVADGDDWIFNCVTMEYGKYVAYEKVIFTHPVSNSILWFTNISLL